MTGKGEYLTIGQMAALNCTSVRTLRFYHSKGLLAPEYVDQGTGHRYYDVRQSTTLDLIFQLQGIGISLEEIKEIIDSRDSSFLRDTVDRHLAQIKKEQLDLERSRKLAEKIIDQCDLWNSPPMLDQILLQSLPERRIVEFPLPTSSPARLRRHTYAESES